MESQGAVQIDLNPRPHFDLRTNVSVCTNGRATNVLFTCKYNAVHSILAEAILNRLGGGLFKAHSAGSLPAGEVKPAVLNLLGKLKFPTDGLCSKSWNDFAAPGAPVMDYVFAVSDHEGEDVPKWPGKPVTAHWKLPSLEAENDFEVAVRKLFRHLEGRIQLFLLFRRKDERRQHRHSQLAA